MDAHRTSDDRRAAVQRGRYAERWVSQLLVDDGWRILGRNVRVGGGELDVIAERNGFLRFVEVKARAMGDSSGLESITHDKRRRLVRAATSWLDDYEDDLVEEAVFDVAIVTMADPLQVEWFEHAFDA